jgi:hypothetical protein
MATRAFALATLMLAVTATALAGGNANIEFTVVEKHLGKVYYGDKAGVEFEFTNTGDAPLVIKRLRPSCGCTVAKEDVKEVLPTNKGRILVTYDSLAQMPGLNHKTVTVYSNDPEKPELKLSFDADVVRELEAKPASLAKKLKSFQKEIPISVDITNHSDKKITLAGAKTFGAVAKVELNPGTITLEPKSTGQVGLMLRLEENPGWRFYMGRIVIGTDHPREKDVRLEYMIQLETANLVLPNSAVSALRHSSPRAVLALR